MKHLVLTICVLTVFVKSHAQTLHVDKSTQLITLDTTIHFDIPDPEIFNNIHNWFVEYFKNANNVISGEIEPKMIKGTYLDTYPDGMLWFKTFSNEIMVRISNGQVTITIADIKYQDPEYPAMFGMGIQSHYSKKDGTMRTSAMYQKFIHSVESKGKTLFSSMSKYIISGSL